MARMRLPLFDRSGSDVMKSTSWAELADGLKHLRLSDREVIHLQVLGSIESFANVVRERSYLGVQEVSQGKDISIFAYSKTVRSSGRRTKVSGRFAVVAIPGQPAHVVICVAASVFIRLELTPLLESLYPRAVRPFLSQQELHQVVRALQRAVQPGALRVLEYSARQRIKSRRKTIATDRSWTDVDTESAFRDAKERNIWFSSIRVEVARRGFNEESGAWLGTHCRISKYGDVTSDGAFALINDVVLPMLTEITVNRVRAFSNRQRVRASAEELRPIELSYDRPLLATPADLKRLLETLRHIPNGTCTVLHGNPYLHVTVVDEIDLSSADVWVLSQNNILIVPQLRASFAALKKLVNHIFENFAEGHIGEAKIA